MAYSQKTIDEQIMRDGLCAVGTLSKNPFSADKYFVVGGVAVQSYLPSSCRRPTADIDLAILRPLYKEDFKKFSESAADYLSEQGYKINLRKVRRAFCLTFENDKGEINFISFPRHNEESYRSLENILAREKEYTRRKIVEGEIVSYEVASPEDITVRKLVRSVNRLSRNPSFEREVSFMRRLTTEDIREAVKQMRAIREMTYQTLDSSDAEHLRFISDLHDIRLLSELTGLNYNYFMKAVEDWDTLKEDSFQRDLIVRSALPFEFPLAPLSLAH